MKQWIIGLLLVAVVGYFLSPVVLQFLGVFTTRMLVYNGNETEAHYQINGTALRLAPGTATVLRSSRLRNNLHFEQGEHLLDARFGAGQYVINLGAAKILVQEKYFPWDPAQDTFEAYPKVPKDILLYEGSLGQGVHIIDNCWDCCLLLPPNDRPYRLLTPENKDKRFFTSSRP
ncbi:MAG: hypothetical protein DA408_09000 [Bacteroidetes bacterium]|nr:MAG: hypothetical protein C7N36_19000 [Bacteroidota bacterium]PTM12852.1 MAG: hypothetical protein DA408_09000 [Bacteroidota bacterium]